MMALQPTTDEARQLQRLRQLQVRRARAAVGQARAAVVAAEAAVAAREARIAAGHAALAGLAQDLTGRFATELPRLIGLATAERRRLIDRIERDDDALLGESDTLDSARAQLAAANAALARALARDDVSVQLLHEARRQAAQRQETHADSEIDDGRAGLAIAAAAAAR